MMPSMPDYWTAIFADLAASAKRQDLVGKLKTADLPNEIKEKQYEKLKKLSLFKQDDVELPGGSFVTRYKQDMKTFICIQNENFDENDNNQLKYCLAQFEAIPEELDESTFMFLSFRLKQKYRIKAENLSLSSAKNIIEIADHKDYSGHPIHDLIENFDKVQIFSVNDDSILTSCNKWFLAAHLSSSCSALRAKLFPEVVAKKINSLLLLGNSNPEHLFYATTSIHLRQCFMEIYHTIENLFYLPWALNLKCELQLNESGRTLAKKLRSSTGWRQKEADSIRALFALAGIDEKSVSEIIKVPSFSGLEKGDFSSDRFARRVYKIRNILVHQEDYDDPSDLLISSECWQPLIAFILEVAIRLYQKFSQDADFTYNLNQSS
jgi:hypothetical protein